MASAPHKIVNGQVTWRGKTKTAAEAARNKDLNRLFADQNWEPIVIPFPRGVMIGFLNWAGNWESFTYWFHQTPEERRWHGGEIHHERERQKIQVSLHRHVAALVRDTEGDAAGLAYLLPEDHEGKEDYLQMSEWHRAYREARAEGKGDEQAREIAHEARRTFAERPEREPVRSLERALELLELDQPVPVSKHVWREFRDSEKLRYQGPFRIVRQGQIVKCDGILLDSQAAPADRKELAWISESLVAGYVDETMRYCLRSLQSGEEVLYTLITLMPRTPPYSQRTDRSVKPTTEGVS